MNARRNCPCLGLVRIPSVTVTPPPTLHHYTTAAGLLGVFEPVGLVGFPGVPKTRSLCLWSSDARYLNDSQELSYAAAVLADAIMDLSDSSDADHHVRMQALAGRVRKLDFSDPEVDDTAHTAYVTSFCAEGNLLSQWRGYGVGGYSIEFPSDVLQAFQVPAFRAGNQSVGYLSGSRLYPVRYGLKDTSDIEEAAQQIVAPENYLGAVRRVVECLAKYKHPDFEQEQEWRLICSFGHEYTACDYRVSPTGMLIPYVQLRFTPYDLHDPTEGNQYTGEVVKTVRVGPGSDQKLRAESVRRMLNQRSFRDASVKESGTPFRG